VCAFPFAERRMKLTEATKLHRKSGVAKWRDLLLSPRAANPNQSAALPFVIPSRACDFFEEDGLGGPHANSSSLSLCPDHGLRGERVQTWGPFHPSTSPGRKRGFAFDQHADLRQVPLANHEVPLPVAWNESISHFGRSLVDQSHVRNGRSGPSATLS
jgi:hypothetical protein